MPADVLSQLLEASWRGIPFPTLMVDTQGSHNVVPHKRVDRDGWRVENTGRNSLVFKVKIPFCNTIARGPGETWRDLYPDTYIKVLSALEDRSTGDFVHPAYGLRKCKAIDWSDTIDPDFRGGQVLTVTLWETIDEGDSVPLEQTSVIPIAASSAADLDAKLGALKPPPASLLRAKQALGFDTFLAFVTDIRQAAGRASLHQAQFFAKINRAIGAIHSILDSVEFVRDDARRTVSRGASSSNQILVSIADPAHRLISALHALKAQAGAQTRQRAFYEVKRTTTVQGLAVQLGVPIDDLVVLNPELAGQLKIPAFTILRYYAR